MAEEVMNLPPEVGPDLKDQVGIIASYGRHGIPVLFLNSSVYRIRFQNETDRTVGR